MLGPFGSSASGGLSPQMLQQLIATMQAQPGGNMRAPMANAAPQFSPGGGNAPAMAAMMPPLQGPQQPQSQDPLALYLQLMKSRQPMQAPAAQPMKDPGPGLMGLGGANAGGPGGAGNPQPGVMDFLRQTFPWLFASNPGGNPAYTGLPGQSPQSP